MGNTQLAEWPSPWLQDHFLIVLLLIGTVFNVIWLLKTQDRLRFRIPLVLLLSLLHTVFGVGCVKLFAFLEGGDAGGMIAEVRRAGACPRPSLVWRTKRKSTDMEGTHAGNDPSLG